jgi:hypothetical protein
MAESLYLEVDESENCAYMPMMVYEARRAPVPVRRVRISEMDKVEGVYEVTGWSSEGDGTPCQAMYAPVSDSGAVEVHLIFGGDWGVRLRPVDSDEAWDVKSPNQYGEPYLMLMDEADVILDR